MTKDVSFLHTSVAISHSVYINNSCVLLHRTFQCQMLSIERSVSLNLHFTAVVSLALPW